CVFQEENTCSCGSDGEQECERTQWEPHMKRCSAEAKIIDVVLLAAVLPWLVSLAASFRFGETPYVQMQLHESLELVGSCMALMVAMLLWLRVGHERETAHLLWVVASLVA